MDGLTKKNFNAVREAIKSDRESNAKLMTRVESLERQLQQQQQIILQLQSQLASFASKLGNVR